MKGFWENLLLLVGITSEWIQWVGVGLIAVVSLWDFIIEGSRGFREYSVGTAGIILIWVGVVMIIFAKRIDKYFEVGE